MMASLSGGLASMGAAVPYAIAAKFAHPTRPVIAMVGDGVNVEVAGEDPRHARVARRRVDKLSKLAKLVGAKLAVGAAAAPTMRRLQVRVEDEEIAGARLHARVHDALGGASVEVAAALELGEAGRHDRQLRRDQQPRIGPRAEAGAERRDDLVDEALGGELAAQPRL